ncbi:MAG: PASTA domain-containing protein [Spirochaetes bacterium]|nr:PASTA domain-containing protein [Spirochaetota bacterium]
MRFYNIKRIISYIQYLRNKRVEGLSVFTSIKRMFLFFFLYLFITGITALIIIFSINSKVKIVTVPKVVNMDFGPAYVELAAIGLNIDVELKQFPHIPKGIVAHQSIEPLKKVKENRTIKLIVSLGSGTAESSDERLFESIRSYIINFKLPPQYDTAKVTIMISDTEGDNRVVFKDVISKTNILKIPVKLHGMATEKIYINDNLYIEKEIE